MQPHRFLKTVLVAALVFMLTLASCSSPEDLPDTVNKETLESLPPEAVLEVVSKLSQDLSISVNEIQIVEYEQVDWPDACLGVSKEDQVCAQVITPGFRVLLEVNGTQYEFHSNQDGTLIEKVTP